MPEKRAAFSLVPSSRILVPKPVSPRIAAATRAHTRNTTRGMGTTPPTREAKTAPNASGTPDTGLPSVRTMAMPPKSSRVPRVARIGGILATAMRTPLTRPHSAPTASAIPRAIAVAVAIDGAVAAGCPSRTARRARAAQIDVTLAMATADRSMPAVNMVNMTPRLIRPNSGNWTAMDCQVRTAKNGPDLTMAKNASSSTSTRTRRVM